MRHAGPIAGRPGFSKKREQGQALVYGLFVLMSGLAALFFLFNTGQLSREKTKLVNTADAVAYSAGVMHARALNFDAYTNRAMVANTVAIAQLVSLSSWVEYTSRLATFGIAAENPKFVMFYPSYFAATTSGSYMDSTLNGFGTLEALALASDNIIRKVLMGAQAVVYAGLLPARALVMDEVAKANYHDDGEVIVDPVPLTVSEFTEFVTRYSDGDRTRFAEVARISADKDPFVPRRSWSMSGLWADCASAFPRVDWLDRRGGTELLGFDEWRAMDTLSEKRWVPKNKTDVLCRGLTEDPLGWGERSAAESPTVDLDPTHYDGSVPTNPGSSGLAIAMSTGSWDYSGLPNFYDLSADALAKDDPRMQFAIRVRRDISQTVTSQGRSAIAVTPRLNAYSASPAGGSELVAVAASEVFFERDGDAKNNAYGESLSKPREIGSLFNPFWQVRLIQSDDNVRKAQALQGAVLP